MYKYAEIIVSVNRKEVDKIFNYKIPAELKDKISVGMRAIVPFGKSNKQIEGYILGFTNEIEIDEKRLKYIISLPDDKPVFTENLIKLSKWMKNKYYTTLASCLKCIMPSGIGVKSDYLISVLKRDTVGKKASDILDYIESRDNKVTKTELSQEFGNIDSSIRTLEKKEIIKITQLAEAKDYSIRVKYLYLNYDILDLESIIEEYKIKKPSQWKILNILSENNGLSITDLKAYSKVSDSPINALLESNLIISEMIEIKRDTINYSLETDKKPELTEEQNKIIDSLKEKLLLKDKKPVLLHGVTGSGKTEIYMNIIDEVIKNGKQAIMLVPEISLTPQTVSRFILRFGDKVSVTHSKLSMGERYDQWKKARDQEISIMIGPRSAIFTPFNNLGIIIIDEEHENSYISDTTPKYNTRDVSIELGKITNSLVLLGSATPSVDSYYKATINEFDFLNLKNRINHTFPEIFVVDMRKELISGNRGIFSFELIESISEALERNEQIILFLNRRGYSTFVSCRNCGEVLKCDKCNVNYTFHQHSQKLICHYCGKQIKNPSNCPVCGSKYIRYFGTGTQKVEEEIKKLYPNENILRMDLDTVSKKHSHEIILNKFKNKEAKILIGTQMIAKGLDFPNVSLVGVIAADISLNNGDYRAGEITYQLLTQVSGRAGRGNIKGKVIVQTYTPDNYSIVYSKENNYEEFFKHEISLRQQMFYPPFSNVFTIMFVSDKEKEVIVLLYKLLDIMNYFNRKNLFEMIGPAPANISKIKNKYRWRIIVKSINEEKLKNFVLYCLDKLSEKENLSNIKINITLNPVMIA